MADAAQCSTGTCSNVVAHRVVSHVAKAVTHHQAYAAPVVHGHQFQPVVSQVNFYGVGAHVRAEAIIEEAKQADPDYQEFLRFKEFQQHMREHGQPPAAEEPAGGDLPPADPEPELPQFSSTQSIINTSCISCHSGENAKGGLDVTKPMDDGTKWRMFMRAADGTMPPRPTNPLPDEQLRELLAELYES